MFSIKNHLKICICVHIGKDLEWCIAASLSGFTLRAWVGVRSHRKTVRFNFRPIWARFLFCFVFFQRAWITFLISNSYIVKESKSINLLLMIRNSPRGTFLMGNHQDIWTPCGVWGTLRWIMDFCYCSQNFGPVRAHTFAVFPRGFLASLATRPPTSHLIFFRFPESPCLSHPPVTPSACLKHNLSPQKGIFLTNSHSFFHFSVS